MLMSKIGLEVLKAREGVKLNAYKDSVGVWTIGYGSTKGVKPGDKITQAEADRLFERDIDSHAAPIINAIKVPLADHERDALISIAFNIGVGGFKRSTFLKRLNAGDKAGCAAAIMAWTKPKEITSRRRAERDQFLTPYDVALPKARAGEAPIKIAKPKSVVPPSQLGGLPDVDYSIWAKGVEFEAVRTFQTAAQAKGYYLNGSPDGKWGKLTRDALNQFRADNGLPPDNSGATLVATTIMLGVSKPVVLPVERSQADVETIEPKSPIMQASRKAGWWGWLQGLFAFGGTVGPAALAAIPDAQSKVSPLQALAPSISGWFWLALICVIVVVIVVSTMQLSKQTEKVVELKAEEYRTGGRA